MSDLKNARIGCVMTGSFCTFERSFACFEALAQAGAELYPIMSEKAYSLDTRYGSAAEMRERFERIAWRPIWHTMQEVEPIGPKRLLDLIVVSPCTGNTLAKLAHGVCDSPAVMAVKSHLRNGRPVLLAISTNDGLARSAQNLGALLPMRHIFFVPFRQDDWRAKPNSLVSDMDLVPAAAAQALNNRQIQPLLLPSWPDSTPSEKEFLEIEKNA